MAVAFLRPLTRAVKQHWFLIGLIGSIFLARLAPEVGKKGGPLKPEITVKFFAVAFIFFTSGLTLRTEELKRAVMQVKVHTFIQGFSMLLIPAVVTQFVYLLDSYTDLSKGLLRGLLVVSCLPPPVSSAAILTRAGGGNEAAAIFNSAFGSFLGIFATPALFMVVVGVSGEVPAMKIVYDLSRTVIVPLVVGQVLRVSAWDRIKGLGIPFSQMAQITLLLIIYSAFCDMFSRKLDIDQRSLVAVLVIVVGMLCTFTVAAFSIARALGYAAEDVVCIMFCSTHKSLTLGLPILKIVFGGDPMLPIMSLPILAYHPCQIFFGGLLVPVVTSWMDKQRRKLKDSKDVLPRTSTARKRSEALRDFQTPTAMRSPSSGSHYDDGYADKVQTSPSRTSSWARSRSSSSHNLVLHDTPKVGAYRDNTQII